MRETLGLMYLITGCWFMYVIMPDAFDLPQAQPMSDADAKIVKEVICWSIAGIIYLSGLYFYCKMVFRKSNVHPFIYWGCSVIFIPISVLVLGLKSLIFYTITRTRKAYLLELMEDLKEIQLLLATRPDVKFKRFHETISRTVHENISLGSDLVINRRCIHNEDRSDQQFSTDELKSKSLTIENEISEILKHINNDRGRHRELTCIDVTPVKNNFIRLKQQFAVLDYAINLIRESQNTAHSAIDQGLSKNE